MWPERYYPQRFWPGLHWPIPNNFVACLRRQIRTRRFLEQRWLITLINSSGTRYELGYTDIQDDGTASSIAVPDSVPDGIYDVEIKTTGLAWKELRQKNTATVVIDRTSSEPIVSGLPLLTNFRYDLHRGWLRLLWEGDVPLADSGLVSAGIWLTSGVPDFEEVPTVTLPLFSYQTSHQYIIRHSEDPVDVVEERYWYKNHWLNVYWTLPHWLDVSAFRYAGLAAISADGEQGPTQYITIPDRAVLAPAVIVEEG